MNEKFANIEYETAGVAEQSAENSVADVVQTLAAEQPAVAVQAPVEVPVKEPQTEAMPAPVLQYKEPAVAPATTVVRTVVQEPQVTQPVPRVVPPPTPEPQARAGKVPKTGAPSLSGIALALGIVATYISYIYMIPVSLEKFTYEYLLLAAIAVVCAVLGLVLSPIAMGLGRRTAGHGRAMAGAGFVLSLVSAAFLAFNIINYWSSLIDFIKG